MLEQKSWIQKTPAWSLRALGLSKQLGLKYCCRQPLLTDTQNCETIHMSELLKERRWFVSLNDKNKKQNKNRIKKIKHSPPPPRKNKSKPQTTQFPSFKDFYRKYCDHTGHRDQDRDGAVYKEKNGPWWGGMESATTSNQVSAITQSLLFLNKPNRERNKIWKGWTTKLNN